MATLYTDVAADQITQDGAVWKRSRGIQTTGDLLIASCRYRITAAEQAADVIQLCQMPSGIALVPGLCQVINPTAAAGTAWAMNIGDDGGTETWDTATAWSNGVTYNAGDLVTSGARVYMCLTQHLSVTGAGAAKNEPGLENEHLDYWKEVGLLDDADRYAAAQAMHTAGAKQFALTTADLFPAYTDSLTTYYATLTTVTGPTAGVHQMFKLVFTTQR